MVTSLSTLVSITRGIGVRSRVRVRLVTIPRDLYRLGVRSRVKHLGKGT